MPCRSQKPEIYDGQMMVLCAPSRSTMALPPSGKVDARTRGEMNVAASHRLFQLQENQVRVATYAQDLGDRSILVNIPSAQLETVEYGRVYARHNIVVGKVSRPTPTLDSKVTDCLQSLLECTRLHRGQRPHSEIPERPALS